MKPASWWSLENAAVTASAVAGHRELFQAPPWLVSGGTWSRRMLELLGIATLYVVLARIGQILAIEPGNVTPVWPASGFALVIVLWRGYGAWPALWLGNFLGNTWAFLNTDTVADTIRTLTTGIAIGPGDTLQACLGAYLLRRYCTSGPFFGRTRHVFCFVGTQAIACLISSTCGVLALCSGEVAAWETFGYTWLTWYLGDTVGIILIAPLLLSLSLLPGAIRDARRLVEGMTICLLSVLGSLLAFNDLFQPSLSFLPVPLVLWAAVRGDQFAVSATVLVIAGIATWRTSQGVGPFATDDPNISLLVLQLYTATTAITGAAVASALSERRQAEQVISTTASRLDQALRGGNVGLWDWDVASNRVYYSPQSKTQLGYDAEEPWNTYQEWESRLHPDDRESAVQRVRDYLQGRSPEYISTFRLRCRDGTYVWILARGEAQWNDQQQAIRLIGIHVDITESKQRAEELEQMTYAASHDLQEPLRSLCNYSQLVARSYRDALDDDGRGWLDAIVRNTRRMQELIHDLRTFMELDVSPDSVEPTDLKQVLETAIENLGELAHDGGAMVTYDRLPIVMGSPTELALLLQNLIGNALKFRSHKVPEVHVTAARNEVCWTVSVSDNGIGVEPRHHDSIFEIFRRLHPRHEFSGTGIGLAICRRVVQQHGGRIWVDSQPNRGSTFHFTIPVEYQEKES